MRRSRSRRPWPWWVKLLIALAIPLVLAWCVFIALLRIIMYSPKGRRIGQ